MHSENKMTSKSSVIQIQPKNAVTYNNDVHANATYTVIYSTYCTVQGD